MPGYVKFDYDSERNIVFTLDHWDVKTREDVDAFFGEYLNFFRALGKKAYMISNIDDLRVYAEVVEYYGETARTTIEKYLLGFARYGTKDLARMTVRTSSLKLKVSPNIFTSREEAIQAIETMKRSENKAS